MVASPLRYPGGKARLFPFFRGLISHNNLFGANYCEPYAGGAGLAIKLLTEGFVEKISLNDIDASICAFWRVVLFRSEEFCELIERTPISIDVWRQQRELWRASDVSDELGLGFAAYFLNRTSRSGIIDGAGPIGGYSQSSKWPLSARFVKKKQIDNIRSLARFRDQIEVSERDATAFINLKMADGESLLYLDPPYFVKGRKLYKNFYTPKDHEFISATLRARKASRWVVSYDDVPEIRSLYAGFRPFEYSLIYSAGPVGLGAEVLYLSDALQPPADLRFPSAT